MRTHTSGLRPRSRWNGRPDSAAARIMLSVVMTSYPRRQQLRRLMSAARFAGCAAIAVAASPLLASAGHAGLAVALGAAAVGLGLLSRRALRLDRRSRVGAESEAQLRRALEPLTREGWRVEHAVDWPGRGDLDHVVRSPSGMGFVIETKTLRYTRVTLRARLTRRAGSRAGVGATPPGCVRSSASHAPDGPSTSRTRCSSCCSTALMPALRRTRPLRRRWWTDATIARTRDDRPQPSARR